jgi:hypothetical protein
VAAGSLEGKSTKIKVFATEPSDSVRLTQDKALDMV